MPRIDPLQLLKCLSVLLSSTGGIISKEEVNRVANLMAKFSKKLVSKCIYVSILKATKVDVLDMFMSAGGWDLVFSWLSDGITAMNWAFVEELVELLLVCPVNIDRLKGNNCPKVIKLLSKNPEASEKVRELAEIVVEQWLAMVKEATSQPPVNAGLQDSASCSSQLVEDGSKVDDENSSVYKITIRDGPQVLAQVISDKSGPRVDTPGRVEEAGSSPEVVEIGTKRSASSEEDDEEEVAPLKKKPTVVQESSDETETSDEDWDVKKKRPGRKRAAPKPLAEKKSPASVKKRKQKIEKPEKSEKKSKKMEEKVVELIHPPSAKPVKKPLLNKLSVKPHLKDEDKDESPESRELAEKDRETLAKLVTPSISSIGRIPKKHKEGDDDSKKDKKDDKKKDDKKDDRKMSKKVEAFPKPPPKPAPKNPSKYNYTTSIGKRDTTERPKTAVKTFNAKFRSTGLEEAPPPPKIVKKSEKKEEVKRNRTPSPPQSSSPTSKKPEQLFPHKVAHHHHHKETHQIKDEEKSSEKMTTPPKPKLMQLQESNLFGDALAVAYVPSVKKKKRRTSFSDNKKEPESPGRPHTEGREVRREEKEAAKPKMKFYQDTLITEEDDGSPDIKKEKEDEDMSSPVSQREIEDELSKTEEAISNFVKLEEKRNEEREKCRLPQGILVYYKRKKILKKSVVWKTDDQLQDVRYFELDETERVNVTRNFMDMKQLEKANEREHMQSRRLAANDIMEERMMWRPLIPVDIPTQEFTIEPGKNSHEKEAQHLRERTVVPSLYFHKKMIPDSPSEPDLEIHASTDPVIIPLNDQTANPESVISYKEQGWPEPKEPPSEPLLETPIMIPTGVPPDMSAMMGGPPPMQMPGPPFMGPGPGFFPPGALPPMIPPGWVPPDGPQPLFNGPPQDLMALGAPPLMDPMFQPNMPPNMGLAPNMPGNMGPPPMVGPGPNVNQGFMGGPQGPPMNFNPPNHFNEGPGPRSNRPWFRSNGPPNQWRHQNKGSSGSWKPTKNKTCINIIKKGFCKTFHCAFKHPPPNTTYS